MRAQIGDRIVVRGHPAVLPDRECRVVEVPKENGEPPFVVRWEGSGRQGPFFPGPDAFVCGDECQRRELTVPFTWPDRYWWGYC